MLRQRTFVAAASVAALLALSACGDDFPDAYTASADEPVATRAELPDDAQSESTDADTPEADASDSDADDTDSDASDPDADEVAETFPPTGEVEEVWAIDNTFRVPDIEVEAGTEVLWINRGRNEHDVEPVDDTQDWGVGKDAFVPGDEYRHVFDTPGVYDYYCTLHATTDAGMIGRVVVVAPES